MIVTGGNSGVGLGIVQALAPHGVKLFIAGRSQDKVMPIMEQVKNSSGNHDIHFIQVDFSSFASVRQAATKFLELKLPLHYLFNNAGLIQQEYIETSDGFETTFRMFCIFLGCLC